MNATLIRIAYDGEAIEAGTMDVRALAPALIALADLFDDANKVLNPQSESAVQVRVHPEFKAGSFEVQLSVAYPVIERVLKLFAGDVPSGLANMLEVLGFLGVSAASIGAGLFGLIRWLRNRPVKKVELVGEDEARISVEDGDVVVRRDVLALLNDLKVRQDVAAVLSPLRRDGIDRFEIRTGPGLPPIETVTRKELPVFEPPPPAVAPPGPPVSHNHYQQHFTLVAVTFREGNKWRLSDGSNTLPVTIQDEDFLQRVDNREVHFAKDDILRCEVEQRQTTGADGLRTEYAILKVLEHRHAARQVVLPVVLDPAPAPRPADQKGPPPVAKTPAKRQKRRK